MNPFQKLPPLPADAAGGRGYQSPLHAREAAVNAGKQSFAIIRAGQEYAWVAPLKAFTCRAMPALMAGIVLVDLQQ